LLSLLLALRHGTNLCVSDILTQQLVCFQADPDCSSEESEFFDVTGRRGGSGWSRHTGCVTLLGLLSKRQLLR